MYLITINQINKNYIMTVVFRYNVVEDEYTEKLLFHQSPTKHSDYTVTGQWRCSHCWQLLAAWWLHKHLKKSNAACFYTLIVLKLLIVVQMWK